MLEGAFVAGAVLVEIDDLGREVLCRRAFARQAAFGAGGIEDVLQEIQFPRLNCRIECRCIHLWPPVVEWMLGEIALMSSRRRRPSIVPTMGEV